jgi:hypothetical protein
MMSLPKGVLAASLALVAACGATRQYTIPLRPDGTPAWEPHWKLRLDLCGNCSVRGGDRPLRYGDVEVSVSSIDRSFGWLLIIPFPFWRNATWTPGLQEGFVFGVQVKNLGAGPLAYDFARMKLWRDGAQVAWRAWRAVPSGTLAPKQSASAVFVVESWGRVGPLFTVDLAAALASPAPIRIAVERFTVTTFGLIALD